ncbi:hypothetical protein H2199_005747 [Coniosporium tulheliwenetii]|uniref:Uncharacterized protein n=1 Tax=Coniosporium tulheliwenetii TaxID=3383036 RepID=A0ACC2Z0W5_9PEZI|nr:hypothetical protein H2199_005747 [Cladosporium sp. JES 115]
MTSYNKRFQFNHEVLGDIIGIARREDVVQFRGIPFASIPARFRQSIVATSLPATPLMQQSQDAPYPAWWEGPLPDYGLSLALPEQDEFKCLNLNLTIPRQALNKPHTSKLPVLVFIHGGGFIGGSNSVQVGGREIYDAYNLVSTSLALQKELIVVCINYRVGPLGFLASTQLEALNKKHGEPVGNYGLHDQRQALEWVSKHIAGFGGNPDNVTIQGTSAGGVSCHFQSVFPQRKFQRAICASGTIPTLAAQPLEEHSIYFDSLCITSYSSVLRSRLTSDVQNEFGEVLFGSDDIRTVNPADARPRPDNIILEKAEHLLGANGMLTTQRKSFPFSHPSVIQAYGIENALQQPSKAWRSWAQLVTDCAFRIAAVYSAVAHCRNSPASTVLLYDFQATNPYEKSPHFHGKANHGINDLYLFNVAEDLVPERYLQDWRGTVAQVQSVWIDFCHGKLPWGRFKVSSDGKLDLKTMGPVFVFSNGGGKGVEETLEEALSPGFPEKWNAVLDVVQN